MKLSLRTALAVPLLVLLGLVPWVGQAAGVVGSGKPATQVRNLAEFQAIHLSGSIDLQVRQGAAQSVTVQADDNLLEYLETVVEPTADGPTLDVRFKRGRSLSTRQPVKVTVVVARLSALHVAGSGDLVVEAFTTPALSLRLSGAGDARLNGVTAGDLAVSIAGSGDVAGSGKAQRLKLSIAGSGDVRLAELPADEVSVNIAGSGDAAVNAQKLLAVSIAGSGDVSYTGNASVTTSIAGSGSVTRR
jgi:hypothetical protein